MPAKINHDNIIALATPQGIGAIGVIRLSGENVIAICSSVFYSKNKLKDLTKVKSHTLHFGVIKVGEHIIDEVLISVFKNPHSYTGENSIEISCHGSQYILQEIINLFLKTDVRMATAGEFTLRAFLNGKLDLSQAEAVADLIASNSKASHQVAMQQMRGGFSSDLKVLRQDLLNFASLIELELDFAEEDVSFANRDDFRELLSKVSCLLKSLISSFAVGNVLKNGIPIAIVGAPNVGKSTLLNALLNDDKAIVSEIAGTTRDAIEDELIIDGVCFRFIDTAGIRETKDMVENIGIKKTFENIDKAQLVLYLVDASKIKNTSFEIDEIQRKYPDKKIIPIINKSDLLSDSELSKINSSLVSLSVPKYSEEAPILYISAKYKTGIDALIKILTDLSFTGKLTTNQTIVSNARHFNALNLALNSINEVSVGVENQLSSDLLSIDIRQALYFLGEITGEVTNDDLLGNIFANFCIGK
ncbi:MAG: tRNA uridine-5-carboxymethylaminomethyl(34) synthesis GTPase MnmE [Flavobacteriales bacterium]|jgi:tRNA modification GTPase|nr:tRNA uridine-5-carboxymethylaminomethyl(34) synthesis GTPase MnmE [Flavobacteriales bacterium]